MTFESILGSVSSAIMHRVVTVAIGAYDGVQDQENAPMSPDPFHSLKMGSGNETSSCRDTCNNENVGVARGDEVIPGSVVVK